MTVFKMEFKFIIIVLFIYCAKADKPCAVRDLGSQEIVCVCNVTYCDSITRTAPQPGQYVAYTTSKTGLRLNKTVGKIMICENNQCPLVTIEIDPNTKYQIIEGFGGAVTDAAGINWKNLSEPLQRMLVNSYFSEQGSEYNMLRVPIGGCDFSTHPYAYNELPVNDTKLSNFTLTKEDFNYKIPFIKAAMQSSTSPIHIVAATWSPPPWMKTNNDYKGLSRLRLEYFDTYADYHLKFLEKYAEEGVPIWGISTGNEPTNGVLPLASFNSMGWNVKLMGDWIAYDLGPKIRNSTFKDIKILCADDQRLTLPYWVTKMFHEQPKALDYIDGVAVHYYMDFITPPIVLSNVMAKFPQKFLLATEACTGSNPWDRKKVDLGSWHRAYDYASDIITDLNYNSIGWIDWNLCLNAQGGPNWASNFVDSPIIVFPEQNEFYKQPMFYALAHFSKFIPRGSQRIRTIERKSFISSYIENVAFVTPRNTIVIVIYNNGSLKPITLKLGNKFVIIKSYGQSITTVELPYETIEQKRR